MKKEKVVQDVRIDTSPNHFIETKDFLQSTLDALTCQIAILDEKGTIIAVNDTWREFVRTHKTALTNYGIGKAYIDVCKLLACVNADQEKAITKAIQQVRNQKKTRADIEYSHHEGDSVTRNVIHITTFDANQRCIVVAQEVFSEQTVSDTTLHSNNVRYKNIVEQLFEGIIVVDVDGKIIEWNQTEERITGIKKEKAVGSMMWEMLAQLSSKKADSSTQTEMESIIRKLLKTGASPAANRTAEIELIRADGEPITVESEIFPIKMENGYMLCVLHKEVPETRALKANEGISRSYDKSYIDALPVGAFILDRNGRIEDVNRMICSQLGYSRNDLMQMSISQLPPYQENELREELMQTIRKAGNNMFEIRLQKRDLSILSFLSSVMLLSDASFLVCCMDISKYKQTEEDLKESEAFLKNILDNIPLLITVKEAESLRFVKVNKSFEKNMGLSGSQMIGNTDYDFYSKTNAAKFMERDKEILRLNASVDIPEERMIDKNMQQRIFHTRKIPIYDAAGVSKYLLSISEDVSEKNNLENESRLRLMELEAVEKLSKTLMSTQTREEALPTLLNSMLSIVNAEMGTVWLFNVDKNELLPEYICGEEQELGFLVDVPIKPGEEIVGKVFETGLPYIVNDYKKDPNLSEYLREMLKPGYGGVKVPIRTNENVIGVVSISVAHPRVITEDEMHILNTLSEIAGNAIHRIILQEQTDHRLKQLSAISTIDRAISSSFDLQVTLELLVSNVISQLKIDAASVLLFNQKSQMLEYSTGQGFHSNIVQGTHLRLGESYAGRVAYERKLLHVMNLRDPGNRLFNEILDSEKFVTYIGVPLIAKGQLKGVLETFKRKEFEPDDDWLAFIRSLADQASIAIDNTQMYDNLQRTNTELNFAYNATIEGWSRALDLRDKETEGHTQRVTETTIKVAREFGYSDNEIKNVRWGSLLHDIGKLGVPDEVLLKPEPLTEEDWKVMRLHPQFAYEMLWPINYLRGSLDIPYCHHEKWDGTGYPRKLKGNQIPLSARIFAVVDIWDALRSDRPYRKAWNEEKVISHLKSLSGSHLDPQVVKICLDSDVFSVNAVQY